MGLNYRDMMDRLSDVDKSMIELAYRNMLPMLVVNLAAVSGATSLLYAGGMTWSLYWLSAMVMLSGLRLATYFGYRRALAVEGSLSDEAARKWRLLYTIGLYAAGSLWATVASVVSVLPGVEAKYTISIIIAALAGGASGVVAPLLNEGRVYMTTLLLPGSIALTFSDRADLVLAGLGVIFLAVMILGHGNNHRILRQSLELRKQNSALIKDLRELNADLEHKVEARTQALHELAHHDNLTGLPNRRGLMDWMDHHLDPQKPGQAAVLFLDLDRFKQINDAMGHDVGDQVLCKASSCFRRCLPEGAILARWGGDEFIVITRQSDHAREISDILSQDLILAAGASFKLDGQAMGLGVSIGRAFFPADAGTFAEVIQLADLAVAEVKRNDRGRAIDFEDTFAETQRRRFMVGRALGTAIATDQLSLAYQPIMHVTSGKVASYEALLRWEHPELGKVSPDEFVRLAEDTDKIVALGDWVLERACREAASWAGGADAPKIAVNVSVKQLRAASFPATVARVLLATGLQPGRLEIEVTESIFNDENIERVLESVQQLRAAGIEIHIDDFGTGYSSLSRLHRFPVNGIKIDKSFVSTIDKGGKVIIESAIMIARQFGFKVVAEGVETEAQASLLRQMGVHYFQGYLFGRPEPRLEKDAPEARWQQAMRPARARA